MTNSDQPTFADEAATRYQTQLPEVRVIGVLSPVAGQIVQSHPDPFMICDQLLIGRELQPGDQPGLVIAHDEEVAREHARIVRNGHKFLLEDLNSSSGTYVDGVPIINCELQDGDTIQIGRSLFCFGRLREFAK